MTSRGVREAARRRLRIRRPNRPLPEALPLGLIVLAATALTARWALATDEWRVMTDEMQYLKLAQSVSETLSPLPYLRGESYGSYSQLFPILLSPVLWLFDVPVAFRIGHLLNAFLMASTAVPTYLLSRLLVPSRLAALTAAALSAFVPWLTLSLSLMTESVGYPAFIWAAFAGVLSLARPSVKHDAFALLAIFGAYLARTQFIFLALALPVAVLLHEIMFRLVGTAPRRWPRCLRDGLRAAVAGHPLLVAAVVAGLITAQVFSSYTPLGNYGSVVSSHQGVPPGMLDAMYDHLNPIVIGLGVAPVVLALAWVGETILRPLNRASHAFVVYATLVIPAVTVTAAYFDLTHVGGTVQERYVFYIAPLILVGAVGYLVAGRWPLPSLALAAGAVAVLLVQSPYPAGGDFPAFASPVRFTWAALDFRAGQIGSIFGFDDLSPAPVLAVATALLSAALIFLLRSGRRRIALPAAGAILLVWSVALTAYVFPKVLYEHEYLAQGSLGIRPVADRDWIDAAVSGDAEVALVPSGINSRGDVPIPLGTSTSQGVWWEAEFWNKAVRRNYSYAGTYAPFPAETMELDERSGHLRVTGGESDYLVWATSNVLVGLDGTQVASYPDLVLYRPRRPYRAAWVTAGVVDDGTLSTGRFGLTVYGRQPVGARLHRVALLLAPGAPRRDGYRVRGAGVDLRGRMATAPAVSFKVCVPAARRETLRVKTDQASQARLVRVSVSASSAPC